MPKMKTDKEKTIGSKETPKKYDIGKGSKPGKATLPKKDEKFKNDQTNRKKKTK